jgi:hypothetical protein
MSKRWLDLREPSLSEVLQDPIVHLVMARDRLAVETVRAELHASARRLRATRAPQAAAE